jgi:hypothetical protein
MAQLTLMAQRPFPFPQPGKTGSRPLPQRPPRLAASSPARASAAARRDEPWARRWGAPRPSHSLLALTHARTARRPANRSPATVRGAMPWPGARAPPWCGRSPGRAGVRPVGIQAHTHLQDPPTQHRTRRGTPARGAPLVAGPRPWRAWVRPAGARAHLHLQQHTHGTKAGSQKRVSSPPATARPETRRGGKANRFTGLAARRAFGAAHGGAVHDDAARGVPQPYLQKLPEPKTATALGRHGLG